MKYFKNTELAKIYGVSEKSVRNWIQAARDGKLDLHLYEKGDKFFIANTPKNNAAIESLVEKGKKYKNSRALKTVEPLASFYELCTPRQVFDLIANLEVYREIPHQYSYLNGGAKHWDLYAHKLLKERTPNSVTNTIQLLKLNQYYVDALAENHNGINVIDIGPGNCLPVREMLEDLLKKKVIKKYIGLDVSRDMLDIARTNIAEWFGNRLEMEEYIRDINYDRFEDVLVANSFSSEGSALNLILFFGGTISNLREPAQALHIINNSMGKDDIFLLTRKLDTEATRRYFDFAAEPNDTEESNIKERNMLNLLGINPSYYTIERFFDVDKKSRFMQATLKLDLQINFRLNDRRRCVEFRKGEGILLWRSDHQTLQDTISLLDSNGFDVLEAIKSRDQQYALFTAKLKSVR